METPQETPATEPNVIDQLEVAAAAVEVHPAPGEAVRQLMPVLFAVVKAQADDIAAMRADVDQLKAEAHREPCEGCGGAGTQAAPDAEATHQEAQG
jgi:hypothetical protein